MQASLPNSTAEWLWVALLVSGGIIAYWFKNHLSDMKSRLSALESRPQTPCLLQQGKIDRLEDDVLALQHDMRDLQTRTAVTESIINTMNTTLVKIDEKLSQVVTTLVTKDDLDRWYNNRG